MAKMRFSGEDVRVLFEHSKSCKEHAPTMEMLCDPKYLKEGERMPEGGFARQEQIDPKKIEPHLLIVKDEGCYLISGGLPHLQGKDSRNHVVYAAGYGKEASWDKVRDALGGDDFAEGIPLSMFEKPMADSATTIWINITQTRLAVEWERKSDKPEVPARVRPPYDGRDLAAVHASWDARVKPRWASAGGRYAGVLARIEAKLVFQVVGNGARRGVIVHERALLPAALPVEGSTATISYPEDQDGVASLLLR